MKKLIRLTESDLRRIVKRSANRILREYMFDNPLNKTDLDGSEVEDEDGLTPEVGTDEYDPGIDDLGMNGPDDNIEGFKSPFYGLRGYMDNDEEFLDNATYDPDFKYFDTDVECIPSDDYENFIQKRNESKINLKRAIRESINKVLRRRRMNEGSRKFETVPEDVARRYGFKPEYNMGNGTELWGRYLNPGETSNMLLFKLGIQSWATQNVKGHVGIYVEPEYTKPEPGSWGGKTSRKIGDYVDTEWADKDGAIFRNPKNGHFKRFNVQDL